MPGFPIDELTENQEWIERLGPDTFKMRAKVLPSHKIFLDEPDIELYYNQLANVAWIYEPDSDTYYFYG